MSLSTSGTVWLTLGCLFIPIYIVALICSIVKIYRDRKRIKEKNKVIRENKALGNGIETQSSVKRPNIEIIHDEERANKFRNYMKEGGANLDESFKRKKARVKDNNDGSNNERLANGHTTNVTIEHCPNEGSTPVDPITVQGYGQNASHSSRNGRNNEKLADSNSVMVNRQNILVSNSTYGQGDSLYDTPDGDRLAITTPSDAGSSKANTDTEIVCETDQSYEYYPDPNIDRIQRGTSEISTGDRGHHYQQKPPRKKQHKHQPGGTRHHVDSRRASDDIHQNSSVLRHNGNMSRGCKSEPDFPGKEPLELYEGKGRRTSSGVIQDEEEKRRKDQDFKMAVIRSKSEDNVAPESSENHLFIHEQGKENPAFERSTENTRM